LKNKWIKYLGGVVGIYLLYITIKKQNKNEVVGFVDERNSKLLNFNDFLPQLYPLVQTRMLEATIEELNNMIKKKGKEATISETKKRINDLAKSNPTVTQIEMMYFYRDVLNRLNKIQ
jgi:hypothetical protein